MAANQSASSSPEWHLIGEGACGSVHATRDKKGAWYAAKTLNGVSINRNLMERIVRRVQEGWVEAGCAPVLSVDWQSRPVCMISPLYADIQGTGKEVTFIPRSLQRQLAVHTRSATSWTVVQKLADSIAASHRFKVAHGNLKPGNVFFNEKGRILLTDYAQGLMPEVSHLPFSDALLYSPPEQLLNPEGYLEEQGYGWDVFAFGVMAYRLLQAAFPRCDKTFSTVAPPPGVDRNVSIEADRVQIANNIMAEGIRPWSGEVPNESEQQRIELILRCIDIDPGARPSTMEHVVAEFANIQLQEDLEAERVEVERVHEAERAELNAEVSQAKRKRNKAYRRLAVMAIIALSGWGAWVATEAWRQRQKVGLEEKIVDLTQEVERASGNEKRALAAEKVALANLDVTRKVLEERLRASREVGDQLFAWAMEEGTDEVPSLIGREERAQALISYFKEFIKNRQGQPGWEHEVEKARLQLAELEVSLGLTEGYNRDGADIEMRLGELDMLDASMKERLLVLKYRVGLSELGSETASAGLAKLGEIVSSPLEGITRRGALVRAKAATELARREAGQARYDRAQELYYEAIGSFKKLGDLQPGLMLLRSEIPQLQIEGAGIAEGRNAADEALELRTLAAEGLATLVDEQPAYALGRVQLAGLHRRVAEGKLLQGQVSESQVALKKASAQLDAVSQPADRKTPQYLIERAGIVAVEANLERDRGNRTRALEMITEVEAQLAAIGGQDQPEVAYQGALVACLRSRLLMEQGEIDESLVENETARVLFESCLQSETWSPLRKLSVRRELAIVCSDAAYTAESSGKKDAARKWYRTAGEIWGELARLVPTEGEYTEAAKWCAKRVKEVR